MMLVWCIQLPPQHNQPDADVGMPECSCINFGQKRRQIQCNLYIAEGSNPRNTVGTITCKKWYRMMVTACWYCSATWREQSDSQCQYASGVRLNALSVTAHHHCQSCQELIGPALAQTLFPCLCFSFGVLLRSYWQWGSTCKLSLTPERNLGTVETQFRRSQAVSGKLEQHEWGLADNACWNQFGCIGIRQDFPSRPQGKALHAYACVLLNTTKHTISTVEW